VSEDRGWSATSEEEETNCRGGAGRREGARGTGLWRGGGASGRAGVGGRRSRGGTEVVPRSAARRNAGRWPGTCTQ
jgi:hypothetical protein